MAELSTRPFVFVAHTTSDDEFVDRICDALSPERFSFWVDHVMTEGMVGSWQPQVNAAVYDCAAFLLIVSVSAANSKWVKEEYATAVDIDKDIIIVFREEISRDEAKYFMGLNNRSNVFCTKDSDFSKAISSLSKKLKHVLSDVYSTSNLHEIDEQISEQESEGAAEDITKPSFAAPEMVTLLEVQVTDFPPELYGSALLSDMREHCVKAIRAVDASGSTELANWQSKNLSPDQASPRPRFVSALIGLLYDEDLLVVSEAIEFLRRHPRVIALLPRGFWLLSHAAGITREGGIIDQAVEILSRELEEDNATFIDCMRIMWSYSLPPSVSEALDSVIDDRLQTARLDEES